MKKATRGLVWIIRKICSPIVNFKRRCRQVFPLKSRVGAIILCGYYKSYLKSFGFGSFVGSNVLFVDPQSVSIGAKVRIAADVRILGNDVEIGDGTKLDFGCVVKSGGYDFSNVKIGENSYLGINSIIDGVGGLEIGNNVLIGMNTVIASHQHFYEDSAINISDQGSKYRKIFIGDDVLINVNSVIFPGVRIGKGAVIGAGSVVTKDVEPYSVVSGVPAKKFKSRKNLEEE